MRNPYLSNPRQFPIRLALTVAAIIAVCLGAAILALGSGAGVVTGMASAALVISVFSAFRGELLSFSPQVLGGDVILPRSSRLSGDLKFLLPLQFTNAGYADGIVEWVALRLTVDGQTQRSVLLSPIAEVDMQKFIQSRRRIDPENTVEPFASFALEAKKAVSKFVLFDLADRPRADPLQLRPGRYTFELFMKLSNLRLPKLARTFEHVVEPKHVEEFQNDVTVYLINYEITLPGVRREVAGVEWLPRQAAS